MTVDRRELMAGIDEQQVEALVEGRHGDPFSILGRHGMSQGSVIRVFAPGVVAVDVLSVAAQAVLVRLSMIDARGLLAGYVEGDEKYMLRFIWPEAMQETEDPYAFGPLLGELDLHLIAQGTHYELGRVLGAQTMSIDHIPGVRFAVWAPNARRVSVVGDFNSWDGRRHPMRLRPSGGVWEIFIPRLSKGERYKFEIIDADGSVLPQKADPVARASEAAPATASVVAGRALPAWNDEEWMTTRAVDRGLDKAMSVYEVHLGSWLRILEDGNRWLNWIELSQRLIPYARHMGFTHIEMMPITEYPFGGSWGYQPLGLFAPTGRYGTPEDFAYFVDRAHAAGLGVIVDWVPAHFPTDVWGLARFDGSALYEHEDPREGFHRDWNTLIYNLGRNEVKGFLIASALEWLEHFHVDGLRVDAVASMLYRDYSREQGQWIPNKFGGRENLEAVEFLKHLNSIIHQRCPHAITIAEESTSWPGVTSAVEAGGLGFDLKWNMGWMHDTLAYMEQDPVYRSYNHGSMTFGMVYAYSERFMLPLSHDEVVHGKGSLLSKMPGDEWQELANLRAYYGFMWGHPGKKLLFMGGELGQRTEWNHDGSVEWNLLDDQRHAGVQTLVRDLNELYRAEPSLCDGDLHPGLFDWAVADDAANSVFAMLRHSLDASSAMLVISNFTPVPRHAYRVGTAFEGRWVSVLNTDSRFYGGSDLASGDVNTDSIPAHGKGASIAVDLPPMSTIYLKWASTQPTTD